MSASPDETHDTTGKDSCAAATFEVLAEGAYHARLTTSSGLAVVLFSAPHCGACRVWKRMLPQALDMAGSLYEVDVSEATGIARYFGIFHLPTVYLYRDGQFHAELQCEARQDSIRQAAQRLLKAPAQDEP